MSTSDSTELEIQLPLIDLTGGVSSPPVQRNRHVEKTLAQLRQLHDELNAQLYVHPSERPIINNPGDAAQLFMPFIGSLEHEEMWVINLDTRNRIMSLVALYKGSVNSSQVRIGEVFRQSIAENSSAIIVGHNHRAQRSTIL
jgi:DNA repair protein RadC